nr:MAG TPA: hypothetical protein [Caudoviricetes sp.]
MQPMCSPLFYLNTRCPISFGKNVLCHTLR